MVQIDIEMPIYCYDCPCHNGENGRCNITGDSTFDKRPFACPLKEVKPADLPSAQPEIVRCKECKWWDKKDGSPVGYCHAAKHGYYSGHWEIEIYRTYKEDFYCADGEREGEE